MIRGAGILFLATDSRALFLKRGAGGDYPGYWCLPGGRQEVGETLEECAVREAKEEAVTVPDGTRELLARSITILPTNSDGVVTAQTAPDVSVPAASLPGAAQPGEQVDFSTYLQRITETFEPKQDDEHVGHAWAPASDPPEPLHPGVRIALNRLTADELGIARMMAAGELTSPQKYMNVWLFAIRITGTGASYRSKKKEYVWRKPEFYLNDEFLARCNGLPVIYEHPEGATLDSKEFGDRVIGAVMLPFIKGDEVWAIARVYDEPAALLMEKNQLSTSPTVVLGDPTDPDLRLKAEDGQTILIEGKAKLLDHVAICAAGVWDKGGEPTGVLSETIGDSNDMTPEEIAAAEKARKDSEEKGKEERAKADAETKSALEKMADSMTKMADGFGTMAKRMDSIEAKADKACADAEEAKKPKEEPKDDARKDGESEEDWKVRTDKTRKDAEEAEAKKKADADEAEKKEKEKADAARADAAGLDTIRAEVAALSSRIKPRTPEDKAKFANAQAQADSAYVMLGKQAPAPMDGEALPDYRRRLATALKVHSPAWKDVNLDAIADDTAYTPIEGQIFADAVAYAKRPSDHPGAELRMVSRVTPSGHTINEFYGPASAWMNDFSGNRQRATGDWKKNLGGPR